MKVLVADKFEQTGLDGLRACGCDVAYEPDLKDQSLAEAIAASGARVLVVRSTQVTGAMLERGCLSLIVRAGAGVNTIDVAAASRRGVYVSNCPGKNAIAVAELAFALLLAIDRRAKHRERPTRQNAAHLGLIAAVAQQMSPADVGGEHAGRVAASVHA